MTPAQIARPVPTLDLAALRPASGRWTFALKARVVEAIQAGEITFAQAIAALDLSAEELASWRRRYLRHGRPGCRETRLQEYR